MKKIVIVLLIFFTLITFTSCSNNNNSKYKTALFSNGLACAFDESIGKRGYVNKKFKVAIDFSYDFAYGFNDGLAIVGNRVSGREEKYMLINTKGKEVSDQYNKITYDYENKVYIAVNYNPESTTFSPKDDYFLLNKKGKVIGHYREINEFNEYNYALVRSLDYERQFINNKGEVLISGVIEDFAYGYAIVYDKEGTWTVDSKLNKLHNFGTSLDRFGTAVSFDNISSGIYYDIYGNNLGYLKRNLEKDGQVSKIMAKKNFWIVNYYDRAKSTVFYNITNGHKISDVSPKEYDIMEDHILILQNQYLSLYNNSLELMAKIEVPANCEIDKRYKTKDNYRECIYFYLDNDDDRFCYKFDYNKSKIERVSFLDEYYKIDYFIKDYICVRKDNSHIGLVTLNGKIFFEPEHKGIIATDDGYFFIGKDIYNKRKKVVYNNSPYRLEYFGYPEDYYYQH